MLRNSLSALVGWGWMVLDHCYLAHLPTVTMAIAWNFWFNLKPGWRVTDIN